MLIATPSLLQVYYKEFFFTVIDMTNFNFSVCCLIFILSSSAKWPQLCCLFCALSFLFIPLHQYKSQALTWFSLSLMLSFLEAVRLFYVSIPRAYHWNIGSEEWLFFLYECINNQINNIIIIQRKSRFLLPVNIAAFRKAWKDLASEQSKLSILLFITCATQGKLLNLPEIHFIYTEKIIIHYRITKKIKLDAVAEW